MIKYVNIDMEVKKDLFSGINNKMLYLFISDA